MALWHFALGAAGVLALSSALRVVLGRATRGSTAAFDAAWEDVAAEAVDLGLVRTEPFAVEGELLGCRVHVTGQRRIAVGNVRATWLVVHLPVPLPFELVLRSRTGRDTVRKGWQPDWLAHVRTNDEAAAEALVARLSSELHPLALACAASRSAEGGRASGYRELVVERAAITIELPYAASREEVRAALRSATRLAKGMGEAQGSIGER
jgi:hypothetical protein